MSDSINSFPFNKIFTAADWSPDAILEAVKLDASLVEGCSVDIPVYQSAWLPKGMMIMTKPLCSCRNYRKDGCNNCNESFWDRHLRQERERVEALKQSRSASTGDVNINWSETTQAKTDSPRTAMEAQLAEIKQLLQDASASLPVIVEKLAQVLSSVAGTFDKRIQALIEAISQTVAISYSPSITLNGDLTAGEVEAILKNSRDAVFAELSSSFGVAGPARKDEQVAQVKACADSDCSAPAEQKEAKSVRGIVETIAEGRGTWKQLLSELEDKLSTARQALRLFKIGSVEWLIQIHYIYALERCVEVTNPPAEEDKSKTESAPASNQATVAECSSDSSTVINGESAGVWVYKPAAVGPSTSTNQGVIWIANGGSFNEAVCQRLIPVIEALEYHARAFIRDYETEAITYDIPTLLGSWLSTLKDKVSLFATCGSHNRDVRTLLKRTNLDRIRPLAAYSESAYALVALGDYLSDFADPLRYWPSFVGDSIAAGLSPDSVLPPLPNVSLLKPATKREGIKQSLTWVEHLKARLPIDMSTLDQMMRSWYVNNPISNHDEESFLKFRETYKRFMITWPTRDSATSLHTATPPQWYAKQAAKRANIISAEHESLSAINTLAQTVIHMVAEIDKESTLNALLKTHPSQPSVLS